jgi:hypothetical protein
MTVEPIMMMMTTTTSCRTPNLKPGGKLEDNINMSVKGNFVMLGGEWEVTLDRDQWRGFALALLNLVVVVS